MKRVLALLLMSIMVASLSSCAASRQETEVVPDQDEEVKTGDGSEPQGT